MLLFGLEILAGTYLVDRVAKSYLNPAETDKTTPEKPVALPTTLSATDSPDPVAQSNVSVPVIDENKKAQQETDHYLKTSVLAVGAAIATPYIPLLLPVTYVAVSYNLLPKLRKIQYGKVDNNLLNASVITICYLTGHYGIAASMSFVSYIGNKLVNKIQDQSEKPLHALFADRPTTVWLMRNGQEIETALDTLRAGDVVVVNGGEVIPVDGIVQEGTALVDQRVLTGETVPAEKTPNDPVFAATLLVTGKLYIAVQQAGEETTIAKIDQILGEARNYKGKAQSTGEAWANKAAPPIIALAGVSLPFVGIMPAANVLFSSPGNMIRVLSSLQTINHLSLLFNQQILVKDGRVLEDFKNIDTILFDKTGTLTTEQPEVINIFSCAPQTENDILSCAALAEAKQTHPLALAILTEARNRQLTELDAAPDNIHYEMGFGVSAELADQRKVRVGSQRMMTQAGFTIPATIQNQLTLTMTATAQ